jgi:hypothetical protein
MVYEHYFLASAKGLSMDRMVKLGLSMVRYCYGHIENRTLLCISNELGHHVETWVFMDKIPLNKTNYGT